MQNWKHYFSELVMLFAAVSAGFWVDNYRDEQSEREVLKRKLEAFVYEYEVVMQNLDSMDFHADYLLPQEFLAYEVLMKGDGDQEQKIQALVELYNLIFLPTEFFDDLIKFSLIMNRDEARFITSETVINGLLRLNDAMINLEYTEKRKADLDVRIVQLFAKHNMVADMSFYNMIYSQFPINFFTPKDTTKYQPKMINGFNSKNESYTPFGNLDDLLKDEGLKVIVQEKYVLYLDDQTTRDQIIQTLHVIIPAVKEEIERL